MNGKKATKCLASLKPWASCDQSILWQCDST